MHEEYYSVNNLPTLCEIAYDTGEDLWYVDEEDIQTPYRCRALSALGPSWGNSLPGKTTPREIHTSASLYNDPTTLGNRTLMQVSN